MRQRAPLRTSLEEVDARVVTAHVEPVLHVAVRLEAQHGEVVPAVVAEEEDPARLEHLCRSGSLLVSEIRDARTSEMPR